MLHNNHAVKRCLHVMQITIAAEQNSFKGIKFGRSLLMTIQSYCPEQNAQSLIAYVHVSNISRMNERRVYHNPLYLAVYPDVW
jgi:hypothetical protein